MVRTLGFQLLTAGVTVVLARLLTPADYGLFAIALSVQLVGQNLAELGLPAALVRMQEAPSVELQAATIGFLLLVTLTIAAAIPLIAFVVVPGLAGANKVLEVTAITLLALPMYATRSVPMAMMDRGMSFGRVAAVEAADTIGFNLFALAAALAGLGVFSLAGAVPFGAMLGMIMAWLIQPSARRPGFDFSRIKPLIGFGSRVSVLGILYLGRDLGFVAVVGALGGASMAGFYAMAKRLFSFPTALAAAVARVGLPALSQSKGERPEQTARMIGQIALVCGLPLALVAGSIQPLITVVLGSDWLPTEDIVLFGSLSMLLGAAVAAPVNSYCLAEGKPNTPVVAIGIELVASFLLVAVLIGALAETGVGIAMSAGTLAATAVLLAGVHAAVRGGAGAIVRAAVVSAIAAAAGQIVPGSNDAAGLAVSLGVTTVVWLALAPLLLKREIRPVLAMIASLAPRLRGRG